MRLAVADLGNKTPPICTYMFFGHLIRVIENWHYEKISWSTLAGVIAIVRFFANGYGDWASNNNSRRTKSRVPPN